MDQERVNAAVKIKMALLGMDKRRVKLEADLERLKKGMTTEEYTQYVKRVQ